MEAAGSAVGIASLGIQVCQGLLSYYHDWRSYHDDIISACDKIGSLERTFTVLRESLNQLSLDAKRQARVQESLISCDSSIQALEKRCTKLQASAQPSNLREKALAVTKRALYPFKASTLAKVSESVNDLLDQLSLAIEALHLDLSMSTNSQLIDVANQVGAVTAQLGRVQHDLSEWRRDDQHHTIVNWLDVPDQRAYHDAARQKHESGTGRWLLESEKYKTWKASSADHLWLHGKAGCGKSVLCSTIIEDLKLHCRSDMDSLLAFFYFSFSDSNNQSYRSLLASLVFQLCTDQPSYEKLKASLDHNKQASVEILENVLLFQISQHCHVTIVLDALDELPESGDRPLVLAQLRGLTDRATNLKTLISSRSSADIEDTLSNMKAILFPIAAAQVNADIGRFIASEFNHTPSLLRWSPKMQLRARETLEQKSDGMFRWVFCQLQELKKLRSTREQSIEAALRSLPVGLNATYKRMLDRIDKYDRKEAVAMLNWLSFALHTITLGELQEARLINPENGGSVAWDDPGSIEDIVEILGDLIHVEEPLVVTTPSIRWKSKGGRDWIAYDSYRNYVRLHGGNSSNDTFYLDDVPSSDRTDLYNAWCQQEGRQFARIRLAHFSVKEYLISAHVGLSLFHDLPFHGPTSQRYLAQSCLAYLCNYSKRSESSWSAQDNAIYPLLNYAVHNWVSHADGHDDTALPNEIALLRDCKAREDWLRARYGIYNSADDALYCACELGHRSCVEKLLQLGEPVNIVGGWGLSQSALQIASETGHLEIVKLLIGAGGDVNWISKNSYDIRTTALYKAAFEGHEEIVAMLLGAGASIQPVMHPKHPGFGTSALHAASTNGHTNIVKRLINAGSDVNLVGCVEPLASMALAPALQVASVGGHEAVVSALIAAGADVNAFGQLAGATNMTSPYATPTGSEAFSTALLAAAAHGHTEVVRRLISAGADPNFVGCIEVVVASTPMGPSMLLHSAGESTAYAPMISALYAASTHGHGEIVSILLGASANLNATNYPSANFVATPLCAAAESGNLGIVATLLAAGADISESPVSHRHPLIAAVENSHVEVVAALIEVGARVNTRSDTVSALGVAAAKGNVQIVEMLVEAGACSNLGDYHGHTALMIASAEGRIDVVKALIDTAAGQPSNLPGFEEAIDLAAQEGNSDIEQLLLDRLMLSQLV